MNPSAVVDVFNLVSISVETRKCLDDLGERLHALGHRAQPDVATAAMVEAQATHLLSVVEATKRECSGITRRQIGMAPAIRTLYGLVAGLETATLWHSPPSGGRACGGVVDPAADHDYQRDGNGMTAAFERAWVAECVKSHRRDIQALTFSSGMAALTTVIAMVRGLAEGHCHPAVVVPAELYHETRFILDGLIGSGGVTTVDFSVDALARAASKRPTTLVLDAQVNNLGLRLLDWPRLLRLLDTEAPETTVVIDTTLLSQSCQPFLHAGRVRVLAVESLTKWSQLGMDRVAGGVVVTDAATARLLHTWREHLGTILPVAALRQLPTPSGEALASRYRRHENNARRISEQLAESLPKIGLTVCSPALFDHPSHRLAGQLGTIGTMLTIHGWPVEALAQLVDRAMSMADLTAGTSFGFDRTRVALISPDDGRPYVRVAAGAGSASEACAAADALFAAGLAISPTVPTGWSRSACASP